MIHNTYMDNTVVNHASNHTSFNGPGGVSARPTGQEQAAMQEHHMQATTAQVSHQQTSSQDRNQFANVNHGKPSTTAMNKVGGQHVNATGRQINAPANTHVQPARQHSASAGNNKATGQQNMQPARQQPQQARQQPQQARQQPQQARRQQQQARPQQQPRQQPQQSHQQAPEEHGGGERR
jgi:hypothetical protein